MCHNVLVGHVSRRKVFSEKPKFEFQKAISFSIVPLESERCSQAIEHWASDAIGYHPLDTIYLPLNATGSGINTINTIQTSIKFVI